MKQKKTITRLLTLACVLLVLVCAVSACGKQQKIESEWTSADTDPVTYFARILPQSPEAYEKFVAASRGYNMSAAGFDDDNLVQDPDCMIYLAADGTEHYVSLAGARAAVELVKPTEDASILKFNEFSAALTAEDVVVVVQRMGTTVDLAKSSNPLVWVGTFLGWITNITFGNYVLALFVFAVIVELLLLYFGIRQQKNTIKQAKLSPKERAIRKKYAGRNDQASQRKMNEEIQKLYQDEGYNMMGGCLPLLIQMPIVIALYNIVIDPLRYVLGKAEGLSNALYTYATTARAAGGLGEELKAGKGTIELLSKLSAEKLEGLKSFQFYSNAGACHEELSDVLGNLPNFNVFGLNMGVTPAFNPTDKVYLWLLLVPVLTFVAYFASMKVSRKLSYQPAAQDPQMGCSNNMMDFTMPAMSVYITFITPAAVGIYWIFKCLIGMAKQFILNKLMPLPTFTEEDYKRAEKEMKGKSRPEREIEERPRGAARSLHHIDDDEEVLPPREHDSGDEPDYISAADRRAMEAAERKKQKAGKRVSDVPMKEDRKDNDKK